MHNYSSHNASLLSTVLSEQINKLRNEVAQEPKNSLLNVNESAYINYLTEKYSIEYLVCDWENKTIDDYEKQVTANQLSPNILFLRCINQNDHRTFPQLMIVCHVPYTGDFSLMGYQPMFSLSSLPKLMVGNGEFTFETLVDPIIPVKLMLEQNINSIRTQIDYINNDLTKHNTSIKTIAENTVKERKRVLLDRLSLLESIAIPIRRIESGEPHSVPILKKKIIIQKPPSSAADYVSDPAIDNVTYQEILRMCYDMGIAMERRPSLYKDANGKIKCEEPLRDVFLVPLSLQFDSVTGETINNAGKTDILIRYLGKNAFIAECKFWRGQKIHHETIDQILRNLTWRDSKSAIIYFVDNKNFQSVLDQINIITSEHPCFLKDDGMTEASWFNYHFYLPSDKSRNVKLAILFVHLT